MRILITLILSYVAAAPLTSKISMDLTRTEWTNVWTYVIWAMSFAIWGAIAIFALAAFVVWADK